MRTRIPRLSGLLIVATVATVLTVASPAHAEGPVGLGTATSFAVLAGTTVTNTGATVISGDVGLSPGTAVDGFPPAVVNNGVIHATDAVAAQAQADFAVAYLDAAGRTPATTAGPDLTGVTLPTGIYSAGAMTLNGTLTLDAQGDPNASWVFQAASSLITGSGSAVLLTNGASACNVFWQVVSSATLGTDSTFVGTILASTSIAATTGANVTGRLLASTGAVTLDANTITAPAGCAALAPGPTTSTTVVSAATSTTLSPIPTSVVLPRTGTSSSGTELAALLAVAAGVTTLVWLRRTRRQPMP